MKISNRVFQVITAFAFSLAAHAAESKAAPSTSQRSLTDPEIVQYVLDADKYEQQASDAAKSKASTPAVRQLAERLSTDHAALDRQFRALPVSAREGEIGEKLTASSQERLAWLHMLQGDQFEQIYADYEVNLHGSVLAALDQLLLRNANDGELRARLQEMRSEAAAHLAAAQRVKDMTDLREMLRNSN